MTHSKLLPMQIRAAFVAEGTTITTWAEAHGFRREDVYAALSGRTRGTRGKAHQIAVALGLKSKPQGNVPGLENNAHEALIAEAQSSWDSDNDNPTKEDSMPAS